MSVNRACAQSQLIESRRKLADCVPSIDLIICDEGQRLKSKDNKTTKMFDELRTVRRIRESSSQE